MERKKENCNICTYNSLIMYIFSIIIEEVEKSDKKSEAFKKICKNKRGN